MKEGRKKGRKKGEGDGSGRDWLERVGRATGVEGNKRVCEGLNVIKTIIIYI